MTSTCNAMRQCAQKLVPKFCASKRAKNTKTHPEKPKMGKTGCVLGAGEDENGCRQGQTDAKSRCLNKCEHHNHTTHVKRKPAETQCFRRFFGRGRRTRTLGTRFWRPLLYQLSYTPILISTDEIMNVGSANLLINFNAR